MTRRLPLISVAVASLLVFSGCGSDDASSASPTGSNATRTTTTTTTVAEQAQAVTDTATPAPSTDAPATVPPATEPPVTDPRTDDGSCVVGSWVLAGDQMNEYYSALTATIDAPVELTASGTAALTFNADGTYAWAPDFALQVDISSSGVSAGGTGTTSGSASGNWTATDGVITTSSEVNDLDMTITVSGKTIDGSQLGNGFLDVSPVNGVTYSCEGSSLVLDFKTADLATTVPVTFTPA